MGRFFYGTSVSAEFDDRVLAHLEIVITSKLRRSEGFSFSWRDDVRVGDGRTTVWVHSSSELVFKYFGGRPPMINRQWLDALSQSANAASGLRITAEPAPTAEEAA